MNADQLRTLIEEARQIEASEEIDYPPRVGRYIALATQALQSALDAAGEQESAQKGRVAALMAALLEAADLAGRSEVQARAGTNEQTRARLF